MNTDLYLRDQLWKQEITREREICNAIQEGQICAYCHDELSEGRPCLNCAAKDHLRALLGDALLFWGVDPGLAYMIVTDLRRGSDRNFKASRLLAASEIREKRRRYR